MFKKLLFAFFIFLIISFSAYYFIYKKDKSFKNEKAIYSLDISVLQLEFIANDSLARTKYLGQTIELVAVVTNIDQANNVAVLDNKLYAFFSKNLPANLESGKVFIIKGRLLSYDETLEEFKMDHSTVVQ